MKGILQTLWGPPGLILLGAILSAIGALWASQQMRIKSEEIAELNKEIVKLVTGGDSFCYLTIMSLDPLTNSGILTIVHQGDHPIYDVSARIVDLQKMKTIEKKNKMNFQEVMQASTIIQIGNMAKGAGSTIGPFPLGNETERNFNIFFSARNGFFTQNLRMNKINNKWVQATIVAKDNKVLFEKIDSDFPRKSDGSVNW